ncbi:MAG: hypothetical protein EPN93_20545 [Spirochaetes bacterium]|nr:MAG: hypothetical protein EPN93_20545 [Spirochaetota bacterium]
MNEFKKFLLVQALISALINMSLNAGIGIFLFWELEVVPLWGNPGIALDTLATAFLLSWLTVLFVAPFAHMEMKKGTVEKFGKELRFLRGSWLKYMPRGFFLQSMIIGVVTAAIFTPVMVGALSVLGVDGMSFRSSVIYKTVFATLLALVVNPVTWMSALKQYAVD